MDADRSERNQAAAFLGEIQERIADPEHWCKGEWHRRAIVSDPLPRIVDQWCLSGAITEALNNRGLARMHPYFVRVAFDRLHRVIEDRYGALMLPSFNDANEHEDVMLVMKEAIAQLEAGER